MLVIPGILVYHLVTGDPEEAGVWGLSSLTSIFISLVLGSALRSSTRDNRQLRASGIPGTAEVLSVRSLEDGASAVLRIHADGLEPFEADAFFTGGAGLRVGTAVDVVVDPPDRLFTTV